MFPGPAAQRLPRLREDIRLLEDRPGPDGAPTWSIHDPVRGSYFSVGLEAVQILAQWSNASTAPELAKLVQATYGRTASEEEVKETARFLEQCQLTVDQTGGWSGLSAIADRGRHGLLGSALHNYLFFKIPLCRPAVILEATLPVARLFVSKVSLTIWIMITCVGVYLASRQMAELTDGLSRQFTLSGAAIFAVTLFIMKIFHELGHAYVATAMGCRVRSMGLAVMMLAPMLYTDVTDAWRVSDRRKRIAIDIAGVAVEIGIAGLAILAWALLPPGNARDVALIVATSALAMTLAINLSPFMRFDGYFIFADLIGVKNLQPRAFALVRWKLREWLFSLGMPCPDTLQGGLRRFVMLYGVITIVYRAILYAGIAAVVYVMTFKLLGLLLFVVEVAVFLVRPLWREIREWWGLRQPIFAKARVWVSTAAAAGLVAFLIVPWSTRVSVPAMIEPAHFVRLFPSVTGEIRHVAVKEGQAVSAGELLITLGSPRLEKELAVSELRLSLIEERLARRIGDMKDQAATIQLEKEKISLLEKSSALRKQIASLSIHAPMAGTVTGLDPDLQIGRPVSRDDELGLIVRGSEMTIRGYVAQQDKWRIAPGNSGLFISDDGQSSLKHLTLDSVAVAASPTIDLLQLSETHGGRIRAHPTNGKSAPVAAEAIHLVTLDVQQAPEGTKPRRGVALIDGKPESFATAFVRRVLKVLVQEAGA